MQTCLSPDRNTGYRRSVASWSTCHPADCSRSPAPPAHTALNSDTAGTRLRAWSNGHRHFDWRFILSGGPERTLIVIPTVRTAISISAIQYGITRHTARRRPAGENLGRAQQARHHTGLNDSTNDKPGGGRRRPSLSSSASSFIQTHESMGNSSGM